MAGVSKKEPQLYSSKEEFRDGEQGPSEKRALEPPFEPAQTSKEADSLTKHGHKTTWMSSCILTRP